jgi:hypothetical protein
MNHRWRWISLVFVVAWLIVWPLGRASAVPFAVPFTEVPVVSGGQNLSVVTVPTRPGVTQSFLLMRRKDAWASVILFTGGNGFLGISPTGFVIEPSNFLVRNRDLFFSQGLNVAVVDPPSDRTGAVGFLNGFRRSTEHAQDIQVVIQFLREHFGRPVWTVGTSNGTFSVAGTAALLQGNGGPDGIVLTSSVVNLALGSQVTLFNINLAAIAVPALVVHHVQDGCALTPYADVPGLVAALVNVPRIKLVAEVGGGPPQGDPCEPWGFHGFPGIESRVVDQIVDFISSHHHDKDRQ